MNLTKKYLITLHTFCLTYHRQICLLLLFAIFIFLRFYELPTRAFLGWDQADSAWAAKSILLDSPLRLEGVPIKGNASMFMGPLYYYLITPFYFFTNLDMIAAPIFAGAVSVVSFCIFYYISKKLFHANVALVAAFFYTFSIGVISADRVQAAYILIPILSYVIFYFLYKCITRGKKYFLYLAGAVGFGFHVHFTTVFYLPIILLTLPFFPKTKKTFLYGLFAILICLFFVFPMLYSVFFTKHAATNGIVGYLNASNHGLHLQRVLQLAHDAFISFQTILQFNIVRPLVFFVVPLFAITFYITKPKSEQKQALILSYLIVLWIFIPWFLLATYTGELTDYYFSLPRDLGIAIMAFLVVYLYEKKALLLKLFFIVLLALYAGHNVYGFFTAFPGNYLGVKATVASAIGKNKPIEFVDHDPISYMYYVYTKHKKN